MSVLCRARPLLPPRCRSFLPYLTPLLPFFFSYQDAVDSCKTGSAVGKENMASFTDRAKAYVRMGKAFEKLGDLAQAVDAYNSAMVEDRTKETVRLLKCCELELKKKKRADYLNPEMALAAKEEGNGFFREGKYTQAIDRYEEAIKRDPTCAPYHNNLGSALCKISDFQGAKRAVEKAIDIDPTYVKAYAKKGDIEVLSKELHKARESYQKGLGIDSTNAACKNGLAQVEYKLNAPATEAEMKQRQEHAMADPEIQGIINDPMVRQVLQNAQKDPNALRGAMADPAMGPKIQKLIDAGVLQVK